MWVPMISYELKLGVTFLSLFYIRCRDMQLTVNSKTLYYLDIGAGPLMLWAFWNELKVANGVYFCRLCLSSTLLLFDNLAYTNIYCLNDLGEENIKHHKRALNERCKILGVKKMKNNA